MKIYSSFESAGMLKFQQWKDAWLMSLTGLLLKWRVTPAMVSLLSGVVAILTLVCAVRFDVPGVFIAGVLAHLFLDGVDGALARARGDAPESGGLAMDIAMDSVGVAAIAGYIWQFEIVAPKAAALFAAGYLAVNLISFLLAKAGRAYDFVIRPRVFVIVAMVIDALIQTSLTPALVGISIVLLAIFTFTGLAKLLR